MNNHIMIPRPIKKNHWIDHVRTQEERNAKLFFSNFCKLEESKESFPRCKKHWKTWNKKDKKYWLHFNVRYYYLIDLFFKREGALLVLLPFKILFASTRSWNIGTYFKFFKRRKSCWQHRLGTYTVTRVRSIEYSRVKRKSFDIR